MDILSKLGVDWRLLIGQIINFLVVLAILYKFAYRPILNLLKKREEKIIKSLADAQKIEENLKKSDEQRRDAVFLARRQAEEIIKKAEAAAAELKSDLLEKTRAEAAKFSAEAKRLIEEEKKKMLQEIKSRTAELVTMAAEKFLAEKLTAKKDEEMIEKSLKTD